ncbi:MAG TPA: zf-HC2 domain-containing protein [Acidimicrobiia bacterium]|nr:zf-HC2 domain-containing protein [Acidimicrobiia bacterium]
MTPDWSEDLLSGYLDGELDAETRADVEARLADDAAWRAVLADVSSARDAVRSLPAVELSPGAWSQILAVVAADEPASGPTTPGALRVLRARGSRAPRWAGLGAAVAAVAAVVAVVVVPGPTRVTPKVATFATEHSARASVASDPVSSLAGVSVMRGLGR